jgi:hypothetical protein
MVLEMTSVAFQQLLPQAVTTRLNDKTLMLWERIYSYIKEKGYADAVDDENFIAVVQSFKPMGRRVVQAHLRRMAKANLIVGHRLRVVQREKNPLSSFFGPLFGDGYHPRTFIRYTLPGVEPSLTVEENARKEARRKRRIENEELSRQNGPEAVDAEHEIEELERWLEDKDKSKTEVDRSKLKKMRKLVDTACSRLQQHQVKMHRLLGAISARSKSGKR